MVNDLLLLILGVACVASILLAGICMILLSRAFTRIIHKRASARIIQKLGL